MLHKFLLAFFGVLLSGYCAIGCVRRKKPKQAEDNITVTSGKVLGTTCTTVTTVATVNSEPIALQPVATEGTQNAPILPPNILEDQCTGQSQYGIKEAKLTPTTHEDQVTGLSQYGVKEVKNEHKSVNKKEHDSLSGYQPVAKEVKRSAEIISSKKVPKGKVEYKTIQSGTSDFDATLSQCPGSQAPVVSMYAFSRKPDS
ncbi:hypothetical protein DdX_03141 [Ditylenchus destructor]|uniref:Uncharacterized protein n=1 Tax=Ditylenchus destructor TaxID=166010 RepID=A0AAD4R6M7_9BILA|nr:hypothetical protein DdX_03141 [Ditylenchus destructor]